MKLRPGDRAPDFDVVARQSGADRRLSLSEILKHKNLVLYFYPRDFTLVCTAETCGFRDMAGLISASNAEIVGVSVDTSESHDRFAQTHSVSFPLISDPERELAERYGASSLLSSLLGTSARVTFVIDRTQTIVAIFDSQLRASDHLKGVERALAGIRERDGID